jgi:hypothetical protein
MLLQRLLATAQAYRSAASIFQTWTGYMVKFKLAAQKDVVQRV